MHGWQSYALALIAVSLLIALHEYGHLIAARLCGMKVERYSIGFGPALLRFQRGETEYVLSAIPFGGYVQVMGMNPAEPGFDADPRSYARHSVGQRFLVVLAGPNPGEEFPLVGDRLTIGRAEDATISINHNSVSRLHCEVHALGDARFEIVDKGSSNGVRVNGADLRRGIVEAGDIIELGDVKFKFVGEGQLFRPGTSESQQLAAISPRSATAVVHVHPGGKSNLLLAITIGTVLALGVIVAYVVRRQPAPDVAGPEPSSTTSVTDTTGADTAMLADARRMCDVGDVEGAHRKAAQLPPGSPLHTSGDFKYIESTWGAALLMQSDAETDPIAKAKLLRRLTADAYADPTMKKAANDRITAIESAPPAPPASVDKRTATSAALPTSPHSPTVPTPSPRPPTPSVPEVTPRPAPRPPSSGPSLEALATSPNPADWQKARDALEPKVFGNRGSADDIRLLRAICKNQHDSNCVTELRNLNR